MTLEYRKKIFSNVNQDSLKLLLWYRIIIITYVRLDI